MDRSYVNLTKSYVTGFVDLVRRLRIEAKKVKIKIKSLIEQKICILNCSEKNCFITKITKKFYGVQKTILTLVIMK